MIDMNTSYYVASKAKEFSDEMQKYQHVMYVTIPSLEGGHDIQQRLDMKEVKILDDEVSLVVGFKENFYCPEKDIEMKITDSKLASKIIQLDLHNKDKMNDTIDDIADAFDLAAKGTLKELFKEEMTIRQSIPLLNSGLEVLPSYNESGIKLNSLEREDGAYKVYFQINDEKPILYDTLPSSRLDNLLSRNYTIKEFADVVEEVKDYVENTYDEKDILEVLDRDNRGINR